MPVILDPDSYDLWHDPGMRDAGAVSELLKPRDAGLMRCYPISGAIVNTPTYNRKGGIGEEQMRNLIATVLLIFSLNTWAQESGPKALSSPEPGVQVRQEFLRAYNAKDVDAVVALYAEDATLVSDGGTFRGRSEIRNWVKAGLDQGSRLEAIEPSVEKSSGTLAYGTGRTRRLVGSVVHLGQYLIVMERISGEWKIVQHFSLNAGEVAPSVLSWLPRNSSASFRASIRSLLLPSFNRAAFRGSQTTRWAT